MAKYTRDKAGPSLFKGPHRLCSLQRCATAEASYGRMTNATVSVTPPPATIRHDVPAVTPVTTKRSGCSKTVRDVSATAVIFASHGVAVTGSPVGELYLFMTL